MGKRIVWRDISKVVNTELLYQELQTGLGDMLAGVHPLDNGDTRIALYDPTQADIATAIQIVQAHDASGSTQAQQTFQQIKTLITGAVGKNITDLTDAERWAVLTGLLYQNKGIAPDMTLRHPTTWIARQDTTDD